ncbi:MAG: tetratricopeptide repeat protein [Rhodoferax sp.]|nr:tetratricopeptide repeat protein [Rhodoferax sp.]
MTFTLQQANTLIVDDFQGMRTMLRHFVRQMGITRISTASNASEAISMLASAKFDVVICDYNLGHGANGHQVLEEAKMRNLVGVSTIWIMVTAEKTTEMVMGATEVKPDDYLLKPINQVLLQSRLEKLIARKQCLGVVETAIRARDFGGAIGHCDQLLKDKAVNAQEILRIKSDLLLTMGEYDAAKLVFESVLAVRNIAWAKTGLGKVLFYAQDYAAAIAMFEQVLQDNRMYVEAADWLAKTYDAMGELARAEKVLLDAVKLSPNSPVRQKNLGDTAFKNGSLDVAQAAFEKNIKTSEFSAHKNPAVYASLAEVLGEKNAPEEALKVLNQSKVDFRANASAALQAAAAESRIYQKMGQVDKAQAALANAEQLADELGDKVSPDLLVEVAKSQLKLGQKDKACNLLGRVIKNNHENMALSGQIEAVFASENLVQEGRALFSTSRQEVIDINNQGVLLAKQGNFERGVELLRSAVQQLPGNEGVIINLAGLLIGQMNKEGYSDALAAQALALLERVHELNPGNKKYYTYTQVLHRLKRD